MAPEVGQARFFVKDMSMLVKVGFRVFSSSRLRRSVLGIANVARYAALVAAILPGQRIFTTTLGLGHFRGYQPQLGQHSKGVENTGVVRDEASVVEFEDVDTVNLEAFASRRHAHESAPVGTRGFEEHDKLCAVRDHKLNRKMQ